MSQATDISNDRDRSIASHAYVRAQTHVQTPARVAPRAANDSPDDATPQERLTWLVELMSRYAREFMQSNDGHESPRLAAAILAHLKSLANDLPNAGRLTDATEHWIEMWEAILTLNLRNGDAANQPLRALIERARAF